MKEWKKSFNKQINPDTSTCECFFHYEDDMLYKVGFEDGCDVIIEKTVKFAKSFGMADELVKMYMSEMARVNGNKSE